MKVFAVLFMISPSLHAYTVTPIIQQFAPTGKESTQTFQIENSSKSPVSLELEVTNREINKEGKEVRTESKDFIIYPLQLTVEGNSKRNVRVSYVGTKEIAHEMPYRLIVRQLPIKNAKKNSGVNFMFEYIASLYVSLPEHQEARPIAKVIGEVKSKNGTNLRLSLTNSGKKHLLSENYQFTLVDGNKDHQVQAADWVTPPLPNYLVGGQSIIELKLPAGIIGRTTKLTVEKIRK